VHLSVTPLGRTIGAELTGIVLSPTLDESVIREIAAALAEHAVLVFRDQHFDAASLGAFGRRFGAPRPHLLDGYQHPDFPEVSLVTNVDAQGRIDPFGVKRATVWHSDETYNETLPLLAMLHGVEVPRVGGGTIFADMRAAFAALPEPQRARLRGLVGLHRFTSGPADARRIYASKITAAQERTLQDQRHPAVLRHPANDREILFVNPSHAHGFVGMDRDEGWELVKRLGEHSVRPEFLYHHHWRVGDLVIWDELSTMHKGAGDSAPEERRILIRTIVHPRAAA
jgi:taurine dioxygenase